MPLQTDLSTRVARAKAGYPAAWKKMIAEWKSADAGEYAWLTYSANYLLRTAGVRWALDPLALSSRLRIMPPPDYRSDLDCLQLVVLSHVHNDHLDLDLLSTLKDQPLLWVIPDFMLDLVLKTAAIPSRNIISPKPGVCIEVNGLALTPFAGLHIHARGGVPEMGYLAEFSGQRWLFPGDTRVYDPAQLPEFGRLDGVFAHLWLGKAGALKDPPPMLDEFISFFSAFNSRRLVISHLNEFGRGMDELWDETHFNTVFQAFKKNGSTIQIEMGLTGDRINL